MSCEQEHDEREEKQIPFTARTERIYMNHTEEVTGIMIEMKECGMKKWGDEGTLKCNGIHQLWSDKQDKDGRC